MTHWYVKSQSSQYSNINGSENYQQNFYENSNRHKNPIKICYRNNEKIECNQKTQQLQLQKNTKRNIKQIGESCNSSLPPRYATFCDKGLKCYIEKPMPGASGKCVPDNYKNKYMKYKKKYLNLIKKNLVNKFKL